MWCGLNEDPLSMHRKYSAKEEADDFNNIDEYLVNRGRVYILWEMRLMVLVPSWSQGRD
jgi:hypothetical protein